MGIEKANMVFITFSGIVKKILCIVLNVGTNAVAGATWPTVEIGSVIFQTC